MVTLAGVERRAPLSERPSLPVCLLVLAWAVALRILATGPTPNTIHDEPSNILLSGLVGAVIAIGICRYFSWRHVRAHTALQWVALYFLAVVPASLAMTTVFSATGVNHAGPWAFAVVPAATWGAAMGLAWVVDQYISRLRASTELRARLKALIAATAEFDQLLEQAEQSRFAGYGDVISRSVFSPLKSLRERSIHLDDDTFAHELDDLVTGTMRPLAHMLHPVSVRTGLIPALRSLGAQLEIVAGEDILESDAAGTLVDSNVRVQVYRWARHLHSEHGSVRLVMWTSNGRLHLEGEGATQSRELDPIQSIAGVELVEDDHITAPLEGTPTAFEAHALPPVRRLSWHLADWRVLFTPSPVISPGVVALVCAITAPALAFINSVQVTPVVLLALAMAVAIPTALAFACRGIRVPFNTTRGALSALSLWAAVGLASGAAQVLILALLASTLVTRALIISLAIRGLIRLLLPGALWMAVQSLTRVNDERALVLQESLRDLQESHRRTLAEADALDREVSETLHRTVQGRLSAASLMIRLDRRAEAEAVIDAIVEQTLPELMASLRRPMTLPTQAQPSPTPTGTCGPLEHYGLAVTDDVDWDGITHLSPAMADALRRSLSENLANAARHGHASVAIVKSTVNADSVIVSCRDDGRGPSHDTTSGLGSRIHDEVASTYSGRWSLDRDGEQTVFTMTLHR